MTARREKTILTRARPECARWTRRCCPLCSTLRSYGRNGKKVSRLARRGGQEILSFGFEYCYRAACRYLTSKTGRRAETIIAISFARVNYERDEHQQSE